LSGPTRDREPSWERIQALFHEARARDECEREAFLEAACGDDAELLREVRALLEEDVREDSLLDRGLASAAGSLLGEPDAGTLLPGRLGPYRVTGVIGEGGMGVVYRAERPDLGSRVAIKILRGPALSPSRRKRFAREQRTLARLDHPSIARVHDADTLADGTPWFAMEYVEGVSLTEYCRARGTSLEGRLLLFRSVCEAVRHAHRHLVVHRDLKPSNVLVRGDGVVKLVDFGIAKRLETLEAPVDQTRVGLRVMTPAYAAPEQLAGDPVGVHTDVYALGVILYELLTGRLPFDLEGLTPMEAARVLRETEPEKPSAVAGRDPESPAAAFGAGKGVWGDLDVLCLTAMHADPARRYPTVEALLRDLDHHLAGEPLEARPDAFGYRLGKFVRRNRHGVAAAAIVILVITGLVGFYTNRLAGARDAALAEAARTERIQEFVLDLFRGGDEEVGPADSLRVVTLLDRGVQEARTLEREPAIQAALLHTLGGVHQQLGRFERADSLLRAALERRRAIHGDGHPDVAESEVALGRLRADQAEYGEAEGLVRRGLKTLERHRPPGHPSRIRAMVALGKVLEEQGEYERATEVLVEAIRLHEGRGEGPDPDLAAALTELGNTRFYAGDLARADSLFQRVLALDRHLYGDRHPVVASDLVNVGAVRHERGRYAEAEGFYRRALELTRGHFGPDHPRTAANLTMLGRSLVFQDRLDEAKEALERAVAIQERVFGGDHPVVASTVNELGTVALLQDRPEEAEAAYARMVRIYRAVHPDDHYLVGVAISNLASVHLRGERYDEAERLFREAVRIFSATQSPEHVNTGIARIKLGRALLRQGRPAEAARETRAGYETLAPRIEPGASWLQTARADLAEAYEALGETERAARFRAERDRHDGEFR